MEDVIQVYLIPWAIKIVLALLVFFIGRWLARLVTDLTKKMMTRSKLDDMLVNFLGNIIYALLLICVVLAALSQLGLNVTSLLVGLGAAGLAVGLALKDSLSNFAAGIMIIIFKPFKPGDYVDAGGAAGTVVEISLFCTLLNTPDNQRIIVPNSSIMASNITNVNTLGTRRLDLVIGISYDDNIGTARDIIQGIVDADSRVLKDPAPTIAVGELGDSSVDILVRPWVTADDYWATRWDMLENIKVGLDQAGISIPYPQQDVYMHHIGEQPSAS